MNDEFRHRLRSTVCAERACAPLSAQRRTADHPPRCAPEITDKRNPVRQTSNFVHPTAFHRARWRGQLVRCPTNWPVREKRNR
jgi:hypothetical protein